MLGTASTKFAPWKYLIELIGSAHRLYIYIYIVTDHWLNIRIYVRCVVRLDDCYEIACFLYTTGNTNPTTRTTKWDLHFISHVFLNLLYSSHHNMQLVDYWWQEIDLITQSVDMEITIDLFSDLLSTN